MIDLPLGLEKFFRRTVQLENAVKNAEYEIEIHDREFFIIFSSVKDKGVANQLFKTVCKIPGLKKTELNSFDEINGKKIPLLEKTFPIMHSKLLKSIHSIEKEVNADKPESKFKIYNSKIETAFLELDKPIEGKVTLSIKVIGDCYSA